MSAPLVAPRLSVGLMAYNSAAYVAEAIESVLAQDMPAWEMIVSDDASRDGTEDAVKPYLVDPRITYLRHETNVGQGANWASVLQWGTAPVVARLDADDRWAPGILGRVCELFRLDARVDLVYGDWVVDNGEREPTGPVIGGAERSLTGAQAFQAQCVGPYSINGSAAFLRRTLLDTCGLPDNAYRYAVDMEYFLRACAASQIVHRLGRPLVVYRQHAANATAEARNTDLIDHERFGIVASWVERAARDGALGPSVRALRASMGRFVFENAVSRFVNGDGAGARSLAGRAIRVGPMAVASPKVLLDWALMYAGAPGASLSRLLHRRRIG